MMNIRLATGLLAALLLCPLLAAPASGQASRHGGEDQQCDGSTREIVECTGRLTEKWDKRLNAAYQKVLGTLPEERQSELRVVQRLWIRYRNANCGYYAGGEGTIARIEAAECLRAMTAERAKELEQMLRP